MNLGNLFHNPVAASRVKNDLTKLHQSTDEMEATLFADMLRSARKSMGSVEWGQSLGMDIWQDQMNVEISKRVAAGTRGGPGDALFNDLAKKAVIQERSAMLLEQRNRKS